MYEIYKNAEDTPVWLGLANERDLVMIKQVQAIRSASEGQLAGCHTSKCLDVIVQMHDWAYRFLSRGWFTRSWIRQEVAASKSCDIVCGDAVISLDDFDVGMTRFLNLDMQLPRHTASLPVQSLTAATRFYRLLKHKRELSTLLSRARSTAQAQCQSEAEQYIPSYVCREWYKLVLQGSVFAATDPKDKVYSMGFALQNALIPGSNKARNIYSDFQMDYKLSMSSAYQNFIKALINTSRTFDSLSFFRPNFEFDPQSTLPAWMPDLRKPVSGCLATSSPRNVGLAEVQQLSDEFRPLRLRGTVLGHIGQGLDASDSVQDLVRVRLDDLEEVGIQTNEEVSTRLLSPIWQVGEPLDTIVTSAGYGVFELMPTAHAREDLFLDTDMTVVFASRDAQAGDLVICAYGGFHPFVIRTNPLFQLPDGTKMQQFVGPGIVWKQASVREGHGVSSTRELLHRPSSTDEVAANFEWQRWRPSSRVMNDRLLGEEEDFSLF